MLRLLTIHILRIIILLTAFSVDSQFTQSMDMPLYPKEDFEITKKEFVSKCLDFIDYSQDTLEYYEALQRNFDSTKKNQVYNYKTNLQKLSPHDRKLDQEADLEIQIQMKDQFKNQCLDIEVKNFINSEITKTKMTKYHEHFQNKISIHSDIIKHFQHTLEALSTEDINSLFLSQLSSLAMTLQSRYRVLKDDPSPVFSCMANKYEDYERRKIESAITIHELQLDFFRLIYPYLQDHDGRIKSLLSFMPVVSKFLVNPSVYIDLDEFCLDGMILTCHGASPKLCETPLTLEDAIFMKNNCLPILNITLLYPIKETSLNEISTTWNTIYHKRLSQFAPKNKGESLKICNDNRVQLKNIPTTSPMNVSKNKHLGKQSQKTNKKKKPVQFRSSSLTITSQKKDELNQKNVEITGECKANEDQLIKDPSSTEDLPLTSLLESHVLVAKEDATQIKNETPTITTPLHHDEAAEKDPVVPQDDSQKQNPIIEDGKQISLTRKEKKEEKRKATAQVRKIEFQAREEETSPPQEHHHHLLQAEDKIFLSHTHFTLMINLLENTLSPNTRYEDIIHAIEGMKIIIEQRGNGDYRKLHLPNGRKIFIYRPAVPQVGNKFLKKLRNELLEKWGLTPHHLTREQGSL